MNRRFRTLGVVCLGWLAVLAWAGEAWADAVQASAAPSVNSASPSAPPVDPCVAAWTIARGWLDQFGLPREHDAAAAVALPGTTGVSVVLRAAGSVVGRGDANPADGLSLRRAMGRAMGEALGAMRSAIEKSGENLGPKLSLEIEFAGEPTPLIGKSVVDASRRVRPGIDGLAVRRGQRWAIAYPGRLLAVNAADNPIATFAGLAADLGLQAADLADLGAQRDVALYRVDTVRLVQLAPGAMPTALWRNDELVADGAVDRDALAQLLASTARRLVRSVYRPAVDVPPRGFFGDYRPVTDERRPPIAPAFEQMLCCLALLHLAEPLQQAVTDSRSLVGLARADAEAFVAETRTTALQVLESLSSETSTAVVGAGGDIFGDRRAAACAVLAILELPTKDRAPWLNQMLEWALTRVNDGFNERDGFVDVDGKPVAAQVQALLASALARADRVHRDGSAPTIDPKLCSRDRAAFAVDVAWRGVAGNMQATLLPWIVWAERDLQATAPSGGASGQAGRRSSALIDLRDQLLAAQAGLGDVELDRADADLRGGFVLNSGGPAAAGGSASDAPLGSFGSPNVTAQSLRPFAAFAAMLAEPAWTPPAAFGPLMARQRAAARFVLQLAVRPPVDTLYRRPSAVVGGIRAATWDCDQPVAPQAMAIIGLVDTLVAWPKEGAGDSASP